MRVHFTNLGCKLNQAELERLAREFHAAGHRVVGSLEEADLHVINSCTVTHGADRTSRKVARRGRRVDPGLRTVLTGCYATGSREEAAALRGVDLVVTNQEKDRLLELVHEAWPREVPAAAGPGAPAVPCSTLEFGNARALVKVEDGCDMSCAFCIIPQTRGPQRSRGIREVVAEVRALVAAGHREIVVTGVQISSYRWRGRRLYDLVRAILDRSDVPRLRLTSIAPWEFDLRLLDLWPDGRLCRHVHLSLQSGSSSVLKRMRRPYTAEQYAGLAERLRAAIPGLALTTDVIVGFPGETDAEHGEGLAFVEAMAFAKIHAFPYSPRPGTHAATLPDQVPHEIKRQRMAAMLRAAAESEARFQRAHLGRAVSVLWEGKRDGRWQGTSDNYLKVYARAPGDLRHALTDARVVALAEGGVVGEITWPGGSPAPRAPARCG